MGLLTTADRIRATDAAGNLKFDTNWALFHTVGTVITGAVNYPTVISGDNRIFSVTNTPIGTCHPNCTHIIGSVKFTGTFSLGSSVGFNRWTTYMGGTLVYLWNGFNLLAGQFGGSYRHDLTNVITYRFYNVGATVYLEKVVVMEARRASGIIVESHRLDWNLKAGLFT